jgi:hypothetical protein
MIAGRTVADITAARVHALPALYRAAALGMPALADSGYEGAGAGIHVPVKSPGGNQELAPDNQARNSLLRGLRFQGEREFALLTQRWAFLQHTTASSPRSPAPPSSSPNSSTNTSGEIAEITSMDQLKLFPAHADSAGTDSYGRRRSPRSGQQPGCRPTQVPCGAARLSAAGRWPT